MVLDLKKVVRLTLLLVFVLIVGCDGTDYWNDTEYRGDPRLLGMWVWVDEDVEVYSNFAHNDVVGVTTMDTYGYREDVEPNCFEIQPAQITNLTASAMTIVLSVGISYNVTYSFTDEGVLQLIDSVGSVNLVRSERTTESFVPQCPF
jgi:hypothetical protein